MTTVYAITKKQIELVENSWHIILIQKHDAGNFFYKILFKDSPELKKLFHSDIESQAQKLVSMITFIVHKLHNIESVLADVRALGVRHRGYQVKAEYYRLVASALLKTLETLLGDDWNEEVKEAWMAVYSTLAKTMIDSSTPKL